MIFPNSCSFVVNNSWKIRLRVRSCSGEHKCTPVFALYVFVFAHPLLRLKISFLKFLGVQLKQESYCFLILIKCDSGRANEECNLDPTVHLLKKEDLTPTQVRKLRYQGFCRKTCDLCDDIIFEKEAKKEEIKLGKFSPPRPTPSRPRVKNFYRQVMGRSDSEFLLVEYL